jgi:hypothetical protein
MPELVRRIDVSPNSVAIVLKPTAFACIQDQGDSGHLLPAPAIEVPNPSANNVRSQHLIVRPESSKNPTPAKWLVKAIARAATWYDDIFSGRVASLREIAEREGVAEKSSRNTFRWLCSIPSLSKTASTAAQLFR